MTLAKMFKRERSGASFSVPSTGFSGCSLSEVSERSSDREYKGDPLDEGIEQTEFLNAKRELNLLHKNPIYPLRNPLNHLQNTRNFICFPPT